MVGSARFSLAIAFGASPRVFQLLSPGLNCLSKLADSPPEFTRYSVRASGMPSIANESEWQCAANIQRPLIGAILIEIEVL